MSHPYIVDDKPSLDDLIHYGIKGMHWGQRMAERSAERKRLKSLDKESKQKDQAARNAEIDAARERYANSSRQNYLDAKAKYKTEKKTIGKREARKNFDAVKQQNIDDYEVAQQTKHGKEMTIAVLGTVGLIAAKVILGAAAARS